MIRLIIWCKSFAKYFLAAWIITIIIVSSIPSIPTLKIHTEKSEIRLDYIIHFFEYGVLAFMTFLSFASNEFKLNYRKFLLITLCIITFAFLEEVHQKIIPGRTFNHKDILSNISGILAALIFCLFTFRIIEKRIRDSTTN